MPSKLNQLQTTMANNNNNNNNNNNKLSTWPSVNNNNIRNDAMLSLGAGGKTLTKRTSSAKQAKV